MISVASLVSLSFFRLAIQNTITVVAVYLSYEFVYSYLYFYSRYLAHAPENLNIREEACACPADGGAKPGSTSMLLNCKCACDCVFVSNNLLVT